jgi:hypothetical protein
VRPLRRSCLLTILTLLALLGAAHAQDLSEIKLFREGVKVITPQGRGMFLIASDAMLDKPHLGVTRAIVVFPGLRRNALQYIGDMLAARIQAGLTADNTLVLAVQFLNEDDTHVQNIPAPLLHWNNAQWESGEDAVGPSAISSYDAIDALLTHLSNNWFYPHLHEVVLAGYGGGGQAVQRYAAVGHRIADLEKSGIGLRFVISEPSSYLYFDDYRPVPGAVSGCENFNTWKYGLRIAPRYVGAAPADAVEAVYIARRVTYLLDAEDDDPNRPDLDRSCAGEAEGPTRVQRGTKYFDHLQARHSSGFQQRLLLVHGAAGSSRKLYTSPCGLDALFATGGCKSSETQ